VINETSRMHIITIEDPIEYYHEHKRSIVNQREVGVDVPTFGEALKRALRQDPDVVLVGEMRDLETMEAAITAAETGHLVFSTLHTTGAARTVDRIVDAFPSNQQEQIRIQLAGNLKAVLSQVLIPLKNGRGRVAAFELMINNSSVASLIRDNKTYRIANDIHTGSKFGMLSLEANMADLYHRGLISRNEVLARSQDLAVANQLLNDAASLHAVR
jgi:twitching motility protein PilT